MTFRMRPGVALARLTALNFLNYIDRSRLPAVQPLVQEEFHRSDADMGWLTSVFFICYIIAAPVVGWLADRYPRKMIVSAGAVIWSGATLLTAVTHDFDTLLIRHTIVGIGEASFVTIAPALVADLYPEHKRGRMLSVLYLAIPVGTALGYVLGGKLGPEYGWRAPFLVAAAPGFFLAMLLAFIPEPARGNKDALTVTPERATLVGLASNRAYWYASLGMAAMTFSLGGFAIWMPTFLHRMRAVPLDQANLIFGIMTAVDGIVATLLGGWLGDYWLRRTRKSYYLVSAAGMLLALPFSVASLVLTQRPWMYVAMFLSTFFLLLNTGPLNAALINAVSSPIRATAVAVNLFVTHILGDVPSPMLIGYISDRSSLLVGFLPAIVAIPIAAGILLYGMRYAPEIPAASRRPEPALEGAV